jgi:hypothetical protein
MWYSGCEKRRREEGGEEKGRKKGKGGEKKGKKERKRETNLSIFD